MFWIPFLKSTVISTLLVHSILTYNMQGVLVVAVLLVCKPICLRLGVCVSRSSLC